MKDREREQAEKLRERLEAHFSDRDLCLEAAVDDAFVDLTGRIDDTPVAIALKLSRRSGVEDITGRLATAVLELQHNREHLADFTPVAVAHVPRLGVRAVGALKAFMSTLAPEVGWAVLDDGGTFHFELPPAGLEIDERGAMPERKVQKTTHNRQAFTDLNRWLLKVMLLDDLPHSRESEIEDGSSDHELRNPNDLQRVADVSQAKAYQFAHTFQSLGFLKWKRGDFRVLRPRRLFDMWYEQERQLRGVRVPVRSIFSTGDSLSDILGRRERSLDYAVGGFAACELHNVLHTRPTQVPWIHCTGNFAELMEALDLAACEEHAAELVLVDMPYRESIFRATVEIDGLRVVDLLQAALDGSHHLDRGREQADFIVEEVLGWRE